MPESFAEKIAVDPRPNGHFISRCEPHTTGGLTTRAYGGSTIAFAVTAAYATVPPNQHLHSLLGNFLGPTRTDRKLQIHITRTRDTKSFATRHILVSQLLDDARPRICAELIVDFHVKEPALLTFSPPPPSYAGSDPNDTSRAYDEVPTLEGAYQRNQISKEAYEQRAMYFTNLRLHWDQRDSVDGANAQTALGLAPSTSPAQSAADLTDRSSAEWLRLKMPLASEAQNMAALAYILDGALAAVALDTSNRNRDEASVIGTLDFALRIMDPDADLGAWHLRQRKTIAGAAGRTISESRLWDRSGRLVAVESQTSIMRPRAKV